MSFNALLVDKQADGTISAAVNRLSQDRLPVDGNVTVAIEYSTLNYKDGLCDLEVNGALVNAPACRRDRADNRM